MTFEYDGLKIEWLGHACIKLSDRKKVYFDPFKISENEKADLILITHEHFDHCSPDDVEKIIEDYTTVFASAQCREVLAGRGWKVEYMRPGDRKSVGGLTVEAVPAYNINKQFHPKKDGKLGYVLTIEGKRMYHAGDTDFIPEMHGLKVDVAFLPVGGTYTMDAEEAAKAVEAIRPKVVVPIHYGSIVGSRTDAERFKALVKSSKVCFG